MGLEIRPTGGPTGAIVTGFDHDAVTAEVKDRIHEAFLAYGVLVFTGFDDLDARTQMAIGAMFGDHAPPHEIPELRHPDQPALRLLAANGSLVPERVLFPTNVNASRERCMAPGNDCMWDHDQWTAAAMRVLSAQAEREREARARGDGAAAKPLFLYLALRARTEAAS